MHAQRVRTACTISCASKHSSSCMQQWRAHKRKKKEERRKTLPEFGLVIAFRKRVSREKNGRNLRNAHSLFGSYLVPLRLLKNTTGIAVLHRPRRRVTKIKYNNKGFPRKHLGSAPQNPDGKNWRALREKVILFFETFSEGSLPR